MRQRAVCPLAHFTFDVASTIYVPHRLHWILRRDSRGSALVEGLLGAARLARSLRSGFETKVWAAADALRNNMAGWRPSRRRRPPTRTPDPFLPLATVCIAGSQSQLARPAVRDACQQVSKTPPP
jgi:hypothetical protein